jgi:hypothetical protein
MSVEVSRAHRVVVWCVLAAAVVMGVGGSPASAMETYRWKKRPLVVFSPTDQHPGLTRQRNIINGNRSQFTERDVVVVYVTGNSVSHELGAPQTLNASALRQRFKVSEGQFRVLLIGKDGGIKLDQSTPLASADLLAEIDRMPMRRDEVRRRGNL